jgi:hypothetical protein
MDALIKFCESEFRLRKQQNPQLKGFDLRPVQHANWKKTTSPFPSLITYEIDCLENEVLIATEAIINATAPNRTPIPIIDDALLILLKKSETITNNLNFAVFCLNLPAGNKASIFEITNTGFIYHLANTPNNQNVYIRAFRLSFYS